ncbi:transcriptional regulator [Longimycelium tulufanense]|uniref:Transcriptional regulator n=1 Tax=Longimycelium tulufanense TaxID=907463 RepID=A0A8J3CCV8_9PSEU|nr:MarR family transcriptional regulator [Longimycelium tulufanense]GGM47433.1 transcriptional regulator [Longimycelium tulufanense]
MVEVTNGGEGGRRGAEEAVERELAVLFRRARSVSMSLAAKVHPGLDSAAYGLLVLIDDAGPLRGSDVVERLGLDKSTVSRQLGELVSLGLVERVPDPSDGRARLVQLTPVGRERLHDVRSERRRQAREHFSSWPTQDLEQLARLLARLNEVL